jgi:hypothetical protein
MYGFPPNLDYASIVGQFTTQICVEPFDLQFTLGDFRFILQSPVNVLREGTVVGAWDAVSWPEPAFYDLMNVPVISVDLPDNRTMIIRFEEGLEAVLVDDSDRYETMQIVVGPAPGAVYIV